MSVKEENKELERKEEKINPILGPRLIEVDGKIQLDLMSLEVKDEQSEVKRDKISDSNKKRFLNSSRQHSAKWSLQETLKFYDVIYLSYSNSFIQALLVFGTDFSMIQNLFKNRVRKQIKVYLEWGVNAF